MARSGSRILLTAAALVLLAGPAVAESYTLTLKNGSTMLTRHRPQEASWDSNMLLVLTDVGNWIALDRGEVAKIVSDIQNRGFAKRLDATTVVLGWSANDFDETAERGTQDFGRPAGQYDQNQFVDPEDLRGGLPATGLFLERAGSGGAIPFTPVTPVAPPGSSPEAPPPQQ